MTAVIAALALAAHGIPSFPCTGPRKRPTCKRGFYAATSDPDALRQLWRDCPGELIGVPTGRASGLVVVDLDVKHGKRGRDWFIANRDALPPTRVHGTASGGRHLLFRNPEQVELRNSADKIHDGADVRAEGGYAIFPPSPGYTVVADRPVAEMPAWLIRTCLAAQASTPPEPSAPAPLRDDAGSRYGLRALAAECEAMRMAPFGGQERALNTAALKIGGLVAGGELAEAPSIAALLDACRSMPSQPHRSIARDLDHVRRSFRDGMRRPRAAPRAAGVRRSA